MTLACDWKHSALALFKLLLDTDESNEEIWSRLDRYEPRGDLALVFEFAVCAGLNGIKSHVAIAMRNRELRVPVEIWLRIAIWPGMTAQRMNLAAKSTVMVVPNVHKFVHALLVASGDEEVFKRFLDFCPRTEALPPPALVALMAVAWEPTIVTNLANSWIDDGPFAMGFWTRETLTPADRQEMKKPYVFWRVMLNAHAAYRKAIGPAVRSLDTTCFNYTPPDVRPALDGPPMFVQSGPLFDALNEFAADREPPELPVFVPAKRCDDTAHLICSLAAKAAAASKEAPANEE
jgi:hypothetical protein